MKIMYGLVALSLLFVGCSSKSDTVPASVSGAAPETAFRGRTLDVILSGSGTSWDAATTVSFGDGIKVNTVTPASASALVANITIDPAAALGPRDVTVTDGKVSEPYTMAFSVESPIDVSVVGTPAQGSVLFVTITNKDLDHLFDDTSTGDGLFSAVMYTNIALTSGTAGVAFTLTSVTPFKIVATALVDASAAAGPLDLDVKSGPPAGPVDDFTYPAATTLVARTGTAISGDTMGTIKDASGTLLYSYASTGVDHYVTLTSDDTNDVSLVLVLDKTGSFDMEVAEGSPASFLSTGTDALDVIVFDSGGMGGVDFTLSPTDTALTLQAGGEGADAANNVYTGAVALATLPALVKTAKLSSATDADFYSVTVPAGMAIHAVTLGSADTRISFFASDGATALGTPVDDATDEDTVSDNVTTAGTYYIRIDAGQAFDSSMSDYELVVILE